MDNQVFFIISAVLFGLVVGALIMYFASGSSKKDEESIAKVEKKLNNYQQDVVQHFEKTADLVDDLTQSYKKVFDHLSQSAKTLLTEEQVKEQIEKRKDNKITLGFLTEDSEPPKDAEQISEEAQEDEGFEQTSESDTSIDETGTEELNVTDDEDDSDGDLDSDLEIEPEEAEKKD